MATQSATKAKPKATSAKTATKSKQEKPAPKAVPKPAPARPVEVAESRAEAPVAKAPDAAAAPQVEMKRKDLLDAVSARAELPRHKVKPVMEAMLAVMGEAIAEGRSLNINPLGRMVRKRHKDTPNAKINIVRVRQPKASD